MAEEEKVEEEPKQERPLPPQTFADFLQKQFKLLVAITALLFVSTYYFELLTVNEMLAGFGLLVAVFVIIPSMAFFRKKPARVSEIEPMNPLKEKSHIEHEFRLAGIDINILEAIPEPFEGEGSDQPYTTHFLAEEILPDGTRKEFITRAGNLTRIPVGWVHRRYLENRTYSSAGTRKRPYEQIIRRTPPIRTVPASVQVVVPGTKAEKEEEEKEEEEEAE